MIKIISIVVFIYIITAQLLSRNWYRFCRPDKECRNISCIRAQDCSCNSLYHHNDEPVQEEQKNSER